MNEELIERAKQTVRVDIARTETGDAAAGTPGGNAGGNTAQTEDPRSIVLYQTPHSPPVALITDRDGKMTPKILSYLDLLYTLERSSMLEELAREPEERHTLPPLPEGAILVDHLRKPSGDSYVVTGTIPPETHTMPVDRRTNGTESSRLFDVPMPHMCYRVLYHERTRTASELSLAVLAPDHRGPVTPQTNLYRYPFTNVYDAFGTLEGVCWPGFSYTELDLSEVPDLLVRGFMASPNSAHTHVGEIRHIMNAGDGDGTFDSYEAVLGHAEQAGAIPHHWLVPAAMTVEDLHEQKRHNR